MKNKSILVFSTFLMCFFTIQNNAQKKKIKTNSTDINNSFDLRIVNYSDQPDYKKVHYHLLAIKNNSETSKTFILSSSSTLNSSQFKNVIANKKGSIDRKIEVAQKSVQGKKQNPSSIKIEFVNSSKTSTINKITIPANQEVNFYAKFSRLNDSEIGKTKYFKIVAQKEDKNAVISTGKSVIIRTIIPTTGKSGS